MSTPRRAIGAIVLGIAAFAAMPAAAQGPLIPNQTIVSTIPPNGDINPYGVAFVPRGFPTSSAAAPGDILVSNFNNSQNLQGTGTTIMRIGPHGKTSVFFQGQAGLGLSTALGVLKRGFVIVGNVPSTDGTSATVQQGSLLVLDPSGNLVTTWASPDLLDGPWDLTVNDRGAFPQVFVSNVLSGTVTRLDLYAPATGTGIKIMGITQIASGYTHHGDPAAFEIGPTGLAYDAKRDLLYVASTGDNAIMAIKNAGTRSMDGGRGSVVVRNTAHLHGPLGLVLTPDGNLLCTQGDAINPDPVYVSEIAEFTTGGDFLAEFSVDTTAGGGAFGLAVQPNGKFVELAAVDDVTNNLYIYTLMPPPPPVTH